MMQIKIYAIPIPGGDKINEEMNAFLPSKKILQVEDQMVQGEKGAFWCFCIKYLDDFAKVRRGTKVDYKAILDEASFERFSKMRAIRKEIARNEAIPAYAVFTDEELANMAKIEGVLTEANLKSIKGIGQKKVEKYGVYFLPKTREDEKS